jgi:hypothetical protein
VGKKTSIALSVVGIILIVVAIVWWTVIGPMLTKLPNDVDTQMDFDGNLTLYVDPTTKQPLAAGDETVIPITVLRTFKSVPDLSTSSVGVFEDTIVTTMAGQQTAPQLTRYALDRSTRKCVESDQNWAYAPQILLDRVGYYGPLSPGGQDVGDKVESFFNDPAKPFELEVVEKIDDWKGLGITALKIDASRPSTPYDDTIAQAVLVQGQGLPTEISFAQFSASLKGAGLDLDALLGGLLQVATPEDLQALQAMTQEPIELAYSQYSGDVLYIEQKTGATVGATFDRTTTMSPDPSGLMGALAIIANYADDPVIGSAVTQAMQAATQLAQMEPTKVFNQNMTIIPSSEQTLAASAKDKVPLLAWANLGIPLIVIIIGALGLGLGVFLLVRSGKKSAAAAPAKKAPAKKPAAKK